MINLRPSYVQMFMHFLHIDNALKTINEIQLSLHAVDAMQTLHLMLWKQKKSKQRDYLVLWFFLVKIKIGDSSLRQYLT